MIMGFEYYICLRLQPFPELWFIFKEMKHWTDWTAWVVIVDGLRQSEVVTTHPAQTLSGAHCRKDWFTIYPSDSADREES